MKPSSKLLGSLVLLLSATSFAQSDPTAPPPPPPAEVAAPEAAPAAATTEPVAAEAAAVDEPIAPSTRKYGMRVRFGASLGLGAWLNPGAFSIAEEARVGLQFNQGLGAYIAFQNLNGFGIGGSSGGSTATASITGISAYRFAVVGEYTLLDRLFVAAGPAIESASIGGVTVGGGTTGGSVSTTTVNGVFPALNARLGLGFGKARESGRRTGFNLMLDATFVFSSAGMSISPMLMFGFESK